MASSAPSRSRLACRPGGPTSHQDIRQTLSGLTLVAKGIGALRTHGGDVHGREKGFRRIDPRIARLSLNAAIETWSKSVEPCLNMPRVIEKPAAP